MSKQIIITGLLFGIIAIVLGAFGAHGLKKHLLPEQLISFETGVKYLMYHGLFLLALAKFDFIPSTALSSIYWLVVIGALFFSGSIFLLTTESLIGFSIKKFAWITPIGGTLLIIAWILTLWNALKANF
ncbi:MAG: DUF423 domain-containing protein [Flavobacteriales bacterium]|nr:DUF423 domain-containing protein [Flavobacteriales bacterium]